MRILLALSFNIVLAGFAKSFSKIHIPYLRLKILRYNKFNFLPENDKKKYQNS